MELAIKKECVVKLRKVVYLYDTLGEQQEHIKTMIKDGWSVKKLDIRKDLRYPVLYVKEVTG